ncbi:MAG: transposase domain-containing protein [Saprospiraceae bacterium]|nr:transposase domain-containing protein [Saprospiraceae bacterium]
MIRANRKFIYKGIIFTLSAKLHKLDPYQYYVEIMKAIPHCEKAEDYEALLPWNIDLVKVTTKD